MKNLKMAIQPNLDEFIVMQHKNDAIKLRIIPTPQLFESNVCWIPESDRPIYRFYYPVIVRTTNELKIFSVGKMLHNFILSSIINSFIPNVEVKTSIELKHSENFQKIYALYYAYNFAHNTLIDLETGKDLCVVKEIKRCNSAEYPIYDSSYFGKKSKSVYEPHIVEKAVELLSKMNKV